MYCAVSYHVLYHIILQLVPRKLRFLPAAPEELLARAKAESAEQAAAKAREAGPEAVLIALVLV